jgi:Domain of unknown function (DUF5597)
VSTSGPDRRRQFLRVEEGTYENGVFKFLRLWNGDETDWGLNFGADPALFSREHPARREEFSGKFSTA